MLRVKVCWKCKEFIYLYPDNSQNKSSEEKFDKDHHEHPLQVVNINELDNNYQPIKYEVHS